MAKICLIPARGGSKRIPNKNIKHFLGEPIISYPIKMAKASGLFDKVIVSTDSQEIANIAKSYGADVPFMRSAKNADDRATLADVVDETLQFYAGDFDYICCLLPTAVLTTEAQLKEAFALLEQGDFDSVRPIVKFSYPIERAFRLQSDGSVQWYNPEFETTRTQDIETAYHDAGQFYWAKKEKGLRSTNRGAIVVKEIASQDIDNLEDWEMAELKFRRLFKS